MSGSEGGCSVFYEQLISYMFLSINDIKYISRITGNIICYLHHVRDKAYELSDEQQRYLNQELCHPVITGINEDRNNI